jgi:hypothetical protein
MLWYRGADYARRTSKQTACPTNTEHSSVPTSTFRNTRMTLGATGLFAEPNYGRFQRRSDPAGRAGRNAPEPGTKSRVTQTVTQA